MSGQEEETQINDEGEWTEVKSKKMINDSFFDNSYITENPINSLKINEIKQEYDNFQQKKNDNECDQYYTKNIKILLTKDEIDILTNSTEEFCTMEDYDDTVSLQQLGENTYSKICINKLVNNNSLFYWFITVRSESFENCLFVIKYIYEKIYNIKYKNIEFKDEKYKIKNSCIFIIHDFFTKIVIGKKGGYLKNMKYKYGFNDPKDFHFISYLKTINAFENHSFLEINHKNIETIMDVMSNVINIFKRYEHQFIQYCIRNQQYA